MKLEDLGIDAITGYHNKILTSAESAFLGVLWEDHVGSDKKISAQEFAILFSKKLGFGIYGDEILIELWKRDIRKMQNHIVMEHNIQVLSKAGVNGGYWIAATDQEAEEFYNTFRARGMTGMKKASRGRQADLVYMIQQLSFEFDDYTGEPERIAPVRRKAELPTPIEIVDSFFERMVADPVKFADGLRKIGEKYSGVLLPKKKVMDIKNTAQRLQEMVASLGI